jgi:hypothetical protein
MYLIALLSSMTPPLLTIKTRAPPMGAERLKKKDSVFSDYRI